MKCYICGRKFTEYSRVEVREKRVGCLDHFEENGRSERVSGALEEIYSKLTEADQSP